MKNLVALCIRNHIFVNILMLLIILSGAYAALTMIRELLPLVSFDMISVTVAYPGASPDEVEEGVCLKLEDAIEGVEGIKEYSSVANEGSGMLLIEVDQFADTQKVKDDVTNRINAIFTFPDDAEEPIITELTSKWAVLYLAVYGDVSERQLKELGEQIKDDLERLSEVSQVALLGVRPYEISIEISEEKLRQYGLTFDQVSAAVARASQNFPGGSVKDSRERINIRTMGRRYRGDEFAKIILLADAQGTSIRLDQVATIRDEFSEDEILTRFNGHPSVLLQVSRTETEDAIRIKEQVVQYVDAMNKRLPSDVRLQVWADSSIYINQRLNLLLKNGAIGLALVFLLLWIFLDLRLAFWVAMGIPVSLAGGLALMGVTGQTINMISLFALIMVLGILVDDAIVVGESIYVQRRKGSSAPEAAVRGTCEVAWPVVAAVITTIVAFVPLMFVTGIMGKFIRVLPIAVISALAVSLIESLIVLPAHLRGLPAFSLDPSHETGLRGWSHRMRRRLTGSLEYFTQHLYQPALRKLLPWRYVVLAVGVALLIVTAGVIKGGHLKFQMFPEIDTDTLIAKVEFPNGTPLSTTLGAIEKLEHGIRLIEKETSTLSGQPMILAINSMAGSQFSDQGFIDNTTDAHVGQVLVQMLPPEERGVHYRQIMARWEEVVGGIPGAISLTFDAPEGGPGGKAIEVWLMGANLAQVRSAADDLKKHLKQFQGVFQVEDDFRPGKRELRARLKPEARNLGLTTQDLGRQLRQGFYGDEVLRVQRGRDDIKVWVRYPLDERRSLGDVENIRIRTADGTQVPLLSVADISLEQGYSKIQRKDGLRRIAVTADVQRSEANADEINAMLEEQYLPDLMHRYPGLVASMEGEQRESAESFSSLRIGFPLALLGIYMILATMFRSYIQPVVIMVTIPFGMIGAVYGHLIMGWVNELRGMSSNFPLTMLSLFGLVALSGVVVNDAIVFIECSNERLIEGMTLCDSLVQAGLRRLRAILLTTVTTCFGLAPLIMEESIQAQFLIPMAVSIAFGVAFATLVTLLLIPCLLLILNDVRRGMSAWWGWQRTGVWHYPTREEVEPAASRNNFALEGDSI